MDHLGKLYKFSKTAFKDLVRNKTRSLLSVTGIVIGITSVIAIIGLSNSANIYINNKIRTYGKNAARIYINEKDVPWISDNEINKLKQSIRHIKYFTRIINFRSTAEYKQKKINKVNIFGIENDYFLLNNWEINEGRIFNKLDYIEKKNYAIIGDSLVRNFFPTENPIGKKFRYKGAIFEVIATLKTKGVGFTGVDYDKIILIPVTTCASTYFNTDRYQQIYISVTDELYEKAMVDTLHKFFRRRHNLLPNEKDNFRIETTREKVFLAKTINKMLGYLMVVVASISLFVGGVGIMNIMLAVVNERIREIGIRMAIGAKKNDIILQFILESAILCFFGGIIGIVFGMSIYITIIHFLQWPLKVSISSIVISTFFSSLVGIVFGLFPAIKASNLKPVEALNND